MNPVQVENFVFTFATTVWAEPYEQGGMVTPGWPAGLKVVDVVAHEVDPGQTAWVIEAKDYRVITNPPKPANLQGLPDTVNKKVRDTLAGLQEIAAIPGRKLAGHASATLAKPNVRAVLHLEPHPQNGPSHALFRSDFVVDVHQKLKALLRDIDPLPLVLSIATTPKAGVPWTVQ